MTAHCAHQNISTGLFRYPSAVSHHASRKQVSLVSRSLRPGHPPLPFGLSESKCFFSVIYCTVGAAVKQNPEWVLLNVATAAIITVHLLPALGRDHLLTNGQRLLYRRRSTRYAHLVPLQRSTRAKSPHDLFQRCLTREVHHVHAICAPGWFEGGAVNCLEHTSSATS